MHSDRVFQLWGRLVAAHALRRKKWHEISIGMFWDEISIWTIVENRPRMQILKG